MTRLPGMAESKMTLSPVPLNLFWMITSALAAPVAQIRAKAALANKSRFMRPPVVGRLIVSYQLFLRQKILLARRQMLKRHLLDLVTDEIISRATSASVGSRRCADGRCRASPAPTVV